MPVLQIITHQKTIILINGVELKREFQEKKNHGDDMDRVVINEVKWWIRFEMTGRY